MHRVTGSTLHNLWHHRLCHAGKCVTDNIDKVADGVPSLRKRSPFFLYNDLSRGKMTNQIRGYSKSPERASTPGGRFHMNYGFVRGSTTIKSEVRPLVISKEGYNCYSLVADEYSCHL